MKKTKRTRYDSPTPKRLCLLTFADGEMLDAVGPLEVFAKANEVGETPLYDLHLVAAKRGPVRMESGFSVSADLALGDDPGTLDTILVAGGAGARRKAGDPSVQTWLRRHGTKARRVGSVCTGAFVLAAGGYLNGRRAATHWQFCQEFLALFPAVHLEPDAIFVRDGRFVTSAGITAGIDLALALIEEDYGRSLAFAVARQLVVYARRAGGQSQFSPALLADARASGRFDDLRQWIDEHLDQDLRVEALAARSVMAPRSFARHFQRETGVTPGDYVIQRRLDAARKALEEDRSPLDRIAEYTGFGHVESLRRAFLKHLAMTPGEYRARWSQRPRAAAL